MRNIALSYLILSCFLLQHSVINAQGGKAFIGSNIGDKAPELVLPAPDGKPLALSTLKGHIVLISFWTSTDANLVIHYPKIKSTAIQLQDQANRVSKGLEIYTVCLDRTTKKWLRTLKIKKVDMGYNVIDFNGKKSANCKAYGIKKTPMYFLLDTDGIIQTKGSNISRVLEEVRAMVERLNAGESLSLSESKKDTEESDREMVKKKKVAKTSSYREEEEAYETDDMILSDEPGFGYYAPDFSYFSTIAS